MSCNTAAVSSVSGWTTTSRQCGIPSCEATEILGHVLELCPKGDLLRNVHHHALLILESAVAIIQPYVFAVLSTLYSSEVN